MKSILFSQLVGLISASFETKKIQLYSGDISWRKYTDKIDPIEKGQHTLSIKWDKGSRSGCNEQHLYLSLDKSETSYRSTDYIYRAYHYEGDNCNDGTRFLYKIMADEVAIIDDLGITKHGSEIGKTYLTKLSAQQYFSARINNQPHRIEFKNRKWQPYGTAK